MIARMVRFITLPPVVTGLTIILLKQFNHLESTKEFIVLLCCLVFFPLLAYPFREIFKINTDRRQGQRSVAMIFSAISYSYGFIWAMFSTSTMITKVFFCSYLISIISLLIVNKALGYHASGHACSTTAPLVLLSWQMGFWYLLMGLALVFCVYSASLNLKRHTALQLLSGSSISIFAGIISISLFI